jgi:hypothetical protein
MLIWNQLTLPFGKADGFSNIVDYSAANIVAAGTTATNETIIPLEFWFCRNPGLALPLIALQYHEVKINIQFNPETSIRKETDVASQFSIGTATLWVDYIFLDTDERRRMAQNPHEYLIDQLQFTGASTLNTGSATQANTVRLNFNHPVKELVWVAQPTFDATGAVAAVKNSFDVFSPITNAKLQLNGQDRFATRNGNYFNTIQPLQSHSNIPMFPPFQSGSLLAGGSANINVYSFGLRPEEHQPSGTCNFSRIDSAVLNLQTVANGAALTTVASPTLANIRAAPPTFVSIYAVNYNVLRIMSGMGGLAYSN